MQANVHISKEFEVFFLKNYPKVKAFAQRLLMREHDAEDVAQDIFLKIMDKPEIWQNPELCDKYLFTMTRNRVLNIIKHRNIERKYQSEAAREYPLSEEFAIDNKIHAQEIELLMQHAVAQMPQQRRDIFLMSRIEHLSHAQIAEQMKLSIRTVERHIYLAISELKDFYRSIA
jgi:RNA polymerase sigma-70 factor (ECF subfamily)